jgi:hypothetical protein
VWKGVVLFLMKLKILSWNVRGLNNPRKREVVKNLLRDWKGDVVCLQETKLAAVNLSIIRSIWGNMYVGWEVLNAVNSAGGILLMWDKRVWKNLIVILVPFCFLPVEKFG